jgi:hypothetical protein
MKTGFAHRDLFEYDISHLKQYLQNEENIPFLWKDISERKTLGSQEETDVTLLYNLKDKENFVFTKYHINEKIIKDTNLDVLFGKLSEITGRVLGRAMFIKLPAKKSISPHIDDGHHLGGCRRIHLPIITDDKVKFIVDGNVYFMPPGMVCEINNNLVHEVQNKSENYRVHLVMDFVEKNDAYYGASQQELDRFYKF